MHEGVWVTENDRDCRGESLACIRKRFFEPIVWIKSQLRLRAALYKRRIPFARTVAGGVGIGVGHGNNSW